MSYTKTTWTNSSGQPISATNLNHIEQGVGDAHDLIGGAQSVDNANTPPTLTASSEEIQRFDTALTANRTVTLPTTGLFTAQRFRIVRRGGGAFTLAVSDGTTTISTIPSSTLGFVHAQWTGSAWKVIATGGNY